MSVRIIDVDDLINTLGISDNDIYCEETIEEYILDNGTLSFAEPERKKGTYTESEENDEWYCWYATCNECGHEWMGSRNFCPNCGADMREGDSE